MSYERQALMGLPLSFLRLRDERISVKQVNWRFDRRTYMFHSV
jgi:hypothetical protein